VLLNSFPLNACPLDGQGPGVASPTIGASLVSAFQIGGAAAGVRGVVGAGVSALLIMGAAVGLHGVSGASTAPVVAVSGASEGQHGTVETASFLDVQEFSI
jgi:hypothetical protein